MERLAQACLESRGWLVERARNIIRWLPDKTRPGQTRPVSLHHDLFSRFDGVYVTWEGVRGFYQVTTEDNFHARRAKVLGVLGAVDPFPVTAVDLILAHRRGTRIFRVAHGPLFLLPEAQDWTAPKMTTMAVTSTVRRIQRRPLP